MLHRTKALALAGTSIVQVRRAGIVARPRAEATGDAKELFNQLRAAFEEFRTKNDEEIRQIKAGRPDAVTTAHVDRINADITKLNEAIDELVKKQAALSIGSNPNGQKPRTPAQQAYHKAFLNYWRNGTNDQVASMRDLAIKAELHTQDDTAGGVLVPEEMSATIDRIHQTVSVMRQIANVVSTSTGSYKKIVNLGGAGAGWVGEKQARPETDTPTLAELDFPAMELYANPMATQTILDDARIDIGSWLGDEVSITFAEKEGLAHIQGTGVNQPRGLISYDIVANGSYAWGKVGYIPTLVAAAISDGSNNGTDQLISLYTALKTGYRSNARWLMNRATVGVVRKLKDGDSNYLWQPGATAGQPASLLGFPVAEDDNMQDIGAGTYPIAFGDFRRAYLIVDRFGIRVLRDPYSNKPYVGFYTTKRTGGGVQNFEAYKLLKVAAS